MRAMVMIVTLVHLRLMIKRIWRLGSKAYATSGTGPRQVHNKVTWSFEFGSLFWVFVLQNSLLIILNITPEDRPIVCTVP